MWFNSHQHGDNYYIFDRYKSDNSRCLELKRTYFKYYNSFYTNVCQDRYNSGNVCSPFDNIFNYGRIYIGSWTFFVIICDSNTIYFYINDIQKLSLSLPNIYN